MWSMLHPFGLQISNSTKIRSGAFLCAFKDNSHGKWVFEKDIFDLKIEERKTYDKISLLEATETEVGLIPNEWTSLQAGLHMSKAERKKELRLQELEESKMKALELRRKREQLKTSFGSFNPHDDECTPSDNTSDMHDKSIVGKSNPIALERKRTV